jgi:hypothetical protein
MEQPTLETFVEELISAKEFGELDAEVKDQLKSDLLGRLEDLINRDLIDELSEEKVSEFEKLLDGGANKDELSQFLSSNIENMEAVVTASLLKFRKSYLG